MLMFADRADAGRRLAEKLGHLRGTDLVVLGLPRGGVPVAFEVARSLGADLDVIVVRKLGVPFQPELGMGAIGEGGVRVINQDIIQLAGISADELAAVETRERSELERRARKFRGGHERLSLEDRIALVIDDGIATGSTARAACQVARAHGARRVVLAVPVAPPGWTDRVSGDADELIALETPDLFFGIGQFYSDFSQTSDEEVVACLDRSRSKAHAGMVAGADADPDPPVRDDDVSLSVASVSLGGHLTVPERAVGLVVFAHGSGSSRHSPRNRYVASVLNTAAVGTLLFDLLTPEEEFHRSNVFDIELLASRLLDVTGWLEAEPACEGLPIGYFGASTGAAAALWAAADPGSSVVAVVSRGGRPDLAEGRLSEVRAPTLLIVGGQDDLVLELNRQAQAQLSCENQLAVVPGATHLFEEPGTLERAAALARGWFTSHFAASVPAQGA